MAHKILIAEDEKLLAHVLELKLKNAGYEVTVASDGEEALNYIESQKFDLVLLDLIMPKKDGFGVLEAMKEKKINTPVIVSSNLGQKQDFEKAKELGAKDFIVKTDIGLGEIIQRINNLLK